MEEKILDKIKKLLRLSESAEKLGSLDEAATAMAMATELMVKYNISEVGNIHNEDKVEHRVINLNEQFGWNKKHAMWMHRLYNIIADHNFCTIVVTTRDSGKTQLVYLIGKTSNIEAVEYMVASFINRLKGMQALAWKNYHGYEKAATFKRGYFSGAVTAIRTKLNAQRVKNEQTHIGLTALVRTNEVALTQKADELFPVNKQKTVRQLSSNDGRTKGYIDGSRLEHNQGLEGSIKDQKALN